MNYLGYLGTLGAPFIDYIIADRTVIPQDQQEFYSEKIAYLPNSFQPTDREGVGSKRFSRAEAGLRLDGFVFCCLNANYKIAPAAYDVWMRILKRVDGSVLWLATESPLVQKNLRDEAAARGVSAERLIFSPRISLPEHQRDFAWRICSLILAVQCRRYRQRHALGRGPCLDAPWQYLRRTDGCQRIECDWSVRDRGNDAGSLRGACYWTGDRSCGWQISKRN